MKESIKDKIYCVIGSFLEFIFCFVVGIFYLMFYNIKDFVEKGLKSKEMANKDKEIDI